VPSPTGHRLNSSTGPRQRDVSRYVSVRLTSLSLSADNDPYRNLRYVFLSFWNGRAGVVQTCFNWESVICCSSAVIVLNGDEMWDRKKCATLLVDIFLLSESIGTDYLLCMGDQSVVD